MNRKKIFARILMLGLGLSMAFSMVACGDKSENGNASSSNGASKGENKVSKSNIETAESYLKETKETLKSQWPNSVVVEKTGEGWPSEEDLVVLEEKWVDDPLFSEIVAVSAIAGLPTYQGAASDNFSVVKADIPNDWADYHVETAVYVALNEKDEVVLAWLDCGQDVSEEKPMEVAGEETPTLPQDNNIRTVLPLSSDLLMAGMRLNEVRAANNLPLIGFESINNIPESDLAPVQNSEGGDPENMTEEEQKQYNEAQEEEAASEEASETEE